MQALVTGGAGFIGSHLTEKLLEAGHSVRVIDNLSTGHLHNLPAPDSRLEIIEGDVTDAALVERAMEGVELVAHLAAVASVQASVDDPVTTHDVNFHGTFNILESMRKKGARRIIYASSAATYGNRSEPPVSEDVPTDPLTPYAADKLAGEHYLSFYRHQFGLETATFRFFNVYGPRQDPGSPYSGVISIFCDRAIADQPIAIFGDGGQTRDFVYVGDVVAILADAMLRDSVEDGAVNIGMGAQTTINQLVQIIGEISGRDLDVSHVEGRPGEVRDSMADISRLKQRFPNQIPETSVKDGLRKLIETLK